MELSLAVVFGIREEEWHRREDEALPREEEEGEHEDASCSR